MINQREPINKNKIEQAFAVVRDRLYEQLEKKGPGAWNSSHEILGIITEEYHELVDAVKNNDGIKDELIDVALCCVFGIACIEDDKCEW